MKRQPIVAGNWKMFGTSELVEALASSVSKQSESIQAVDLIVFPPFVYLQRVAGVLAGTQIAWGGQDVSTALSGAYTGEVAAPMLKDLACRYVLVGHSERRQYHHETDELVVQKSVVAREQGLQPIICVGETLEQRQRDETEQVITQQVKAILMSCSQSEQFAQLIIAYEPVWAIGSGLSATPEQAQAVHQLIRALIAECDEVGANRSRILYGGSVKPENAADLFAQADIDGGLIGGASLKADSFIEIARAAQFASVVEAE